jgi:NADPH:quinone reductase-like Zn-dependent oxidoreductase
MRVIAVRTQRDPRRLMELATAAAERRLVIPVERTFPLEQAPAAFRLARQGATGKVLLLP